MPGGVLCLGGVTVNTDETLVVGNGGLAKDQADAKPQCVLTRYPIKPEVASIHYTQSLDEPNPHLTPDQHRVLFTATFSGTPQAYAVEMPKEFWR